MKYFLFSLLVGILFIQLAQAKTPLKEYTIPFGGRVLTTTLPAVSCLNPTGTAPVVLTSNLGGLVRAGVSAADGNASTGQRIAGTAAGLYRAIPLYTWGFSPTGTVQQPKPGDWILGRQKIIPNLSTCVIDGVNVPFPVVETNNFGISQPLNLRR